MRQLGIGLLVGTLGLLPLVSALQAREVKMLLPLRGTAWVLERLGERPLPPQLRSRPTLMLESSGDRVSGSDGCNRFFGSYRLDGDRLSLGPLGSTRMACPGLANLDGDVQQMLTQVQRWRIQGSKLQLLGPGPHPLAEYRLP